LLQARGGKELKGKARVDSQMRFDDYVRMLEGYEFTEEHDACHSHMKLVQSGGYFEAMWRRRSRS